MIVWSLITDIGEFEILTDNVGKITQIHPEQTLMDYWIKAGFVELSRFSDFAGWILKQDRCVD